MDSRIREGIENELGVAYSFKVTDLSNDVWTSWLRWKEGAIDRILALLTADPEPCLVQAEPEFPSHPGGYSGGEPDPCDGMDAVFQRAFCVSHLDLMSNDQSVAYETFKAGWKAATQVSDKRAKDLREELDHGDSWMERAKAFMENGGCPVCFSTDEDGHTQGCEYGKAEKEAEDLREQVQRLRDELEYSERRLTTSYQASQSLREDVSRLKNLLEEYRQELMEAKGSIAATDPTT